MQRTDGGVEFWLARDLRHLLGYAEWRNFGTVVSRTKTACELSGHKVTDHFVDINKMVDLGSGILDAEGEQVRVEVNGVDVFHPNTGEVRGDGADGIACWFIDTDYNEECFFVRHAYFLGANDP